MTSVEVNHGFEKIGRLFGSITEGTVHIHLLVLRGREIFDAAEEEAHMLSFYLDVDLEQERARNRFTVAVLLEVDPRNYQEQEFSDTDAFFAWTFVNKRPLWQTFLSLSWPILTLAICLFPVYPHQEKLLILYSCAGVLLLILCLLLDL
ncbi:translocation protein SEC62-like protein [Tanacetum coccineum]